MGAMEEDAFRDGKSNKVQNLNVNMSPAATNDIRQAMVSGLNQQQNQRRSSKNMHG